MKDKGTTAAFPAISSFLALQSNAGSFPFKLSQLPASLTYLELDHPVEMPHKEKVVIT